MIEEIFGFKAKDLPENFDFDGWTTPWNLSQLVTVQEHEGGTACLEVSRIAGIIYFTGWIKLIGTNHCLFSPVHVKNRSRARIPAGSFTIVKDSGNEYLLKFQNIESITILDEPPF